ncbi:MAG: S24/S26 family peptidase [Deltaproteobacteria bacterium]
MELIEAKMDKGDTQDMLVLTSGYSMWPFIKPGQPLLVRQVPFETLRTGDLIVFRRGEMFCHRLIRKEKSGEGWVLLVRGDNQLSSERIPGTWYRGKVMMTMRGKSAAALTGMGARISGILIALTMPFFVRLKQTLKRLLLRR